MRVRDILAAKGANVVTCSAGTSVMSAVHTMRRAGIGALVVCDGTGDNARIEGIVSERDVMRGVADHGAGIAEKRVSDIMTSVLITCAADDTVRTLMAEMTLHRVRHIPVVDGSRLVGIVSIGDVVKNRLEELELETDVLRSAYLTRNSD